MAVKKKILYYTLYAISHTLFAGSEALEMKIKIIFDKDTVDSKYDTGWGISYLIGERILFDTGEKFSYLEHNMKLLNADINKIDKIVISHPYWDHCGGLWDILKVKKDTEVFVCEDFIEEYYFDKHIEDIQQYHFKEVSEYGKLEENVYTAACFRNLSQNLTIWEQVLVIETNRGMTIICGCARIGILEIIHRIKEIFSKKIYSIYGGLHLLEQDRRFINYTIEEMKKNGIEKVGTSHCTGHEAAMLIRDVYGENFIEMKVGMELEIL